MTETTNYRPVSKLSVVSILFEKVSKQIFEDLEVNDILTEERDGIRQYNSTETSRWINGV